MRTWKSVKEVGENVTVRKEQELFTPVIPRNDGFKGGQDKPICHSEQCRGSRMSSLTLFFNEQWNALLFNFGLFGRRWRFHRQWHFWTPTRFPPSEMTSVGVVSSKKRWLQSLTFKAAPILELGTFVRGAQILRKCNLGHKMFSIQWLNAELSWEQH